MCLTCNCGMPDEKHGRKENITKKDIETAAKVNMMSVEETINNLKQSLNDLEVELEPSINSSKRNIDKAKANNSVKDLDEDESDA